MRPLTMNALLLSVVLGLTSSRPAAQDLPALAVSPSKVNLLVGETHGFRAVGKDGRMRHHVRWSIAPEHAATLTQNGDEAMVQAIEISSVVVLTAYVEGDSADGNIEILGGNSLPIGSVIWSVKEIPGCTDKKIIPAVPSAGGPDLCVQEECPQGTGVRAITEDGRELWQRVLGGPGAALPAEFTAKTEAQPAQPLNPHNTSACDAISAGMTRESVGKIIADHNLQLEEKQRSGNQWLLEADGFRCAISFDDAGGTVIKKKKTVVTD